MKKINFGCDQKTCFLCRECLPDWQTAVADRKQNLKFKKGEVIFEEGSPVKGIYFLYKGKIKVHTQWGTDKQLILYFAKDGDMVGYRGLGDERVYPVTATVLEDSIMCYVDMIFFETVLRGNHRLTYELMKFYANELHETERRMRNLVHMDVKGRVAETMLMLQTKFGTDANGSITIKLAKQDIASYVGTTYETLYRVMQEFTNAGIVALDGKNICILNEAELRSMATAVHT